MTSLQRDTLDVQSLIGTVRSESVATTVTRENGKRLSFPRNILSSLHKAVKKKEQSVTEKPCLNKATNTAKSVKKTGNLTLPRVRVSPQKSSTKMEKNAAKMKFPRLKGKAKDVPRTTKFNKMIKR